LEELGVGSSKKRLGSSSILDRLMFWDTWRVKMTDARESSTGTGSCFGIPGDNRGWGQWYWYRLVFWDTWRQ